MINLNKDMDTSNKKYCGNRRCFFIPLLIVGIFVVSGVVMLLWNWIIPGISTLSPLTYWQAMGIFILSRILFGGFRFHSHRGGYRHVHRFHTKIKDRFMDMNEDEKQQFKNQWKKRCCK
jgi:Ca2+/H+ antiporter, TMEM165/GDT1 family